MKQSEFLRGGLDVAILAGLRHDESYGYELLTRLRAAGLDELGDASVYGGLKRMEKAGLLESRLASSDAGPARRYYRMSGTGRRALDASVAEWRQLRDALDRLIDARGEA